ncbi:adenylyl-sulfate kinase [Desulfobulbus sp.]|uniref:adenylyl-sulfate kinase n=1 Tax=Desulfobulbus sp. TaxID=895 RepID=UPI00286FACFE|nr:adenylyl-sulfate kinase [Desulfobulbus sp.]
MKNNVIHLIAPRSLVSQEMREARQNHRGMAFWLTGLSGAGKSTLAHAAEVLLFQKNYRITVLDGDVIRAGLCGDLGFSMEERRENNRRVAELAKIFVRSGIICLCAFISPSAAFRQEARRIIGEDFFREVHVDCSVEECERRDVKGFYEKARQGKIRNYTGVSSGYEVPQSPDCILRTEHASEQDCARYLASFIEENAKIGH